MGNGNNDSLRKFGYWAVRIVFMVLIGMLGWFAKDKMQNNDERLRAVEKDVKGVSNQLYMNDLVMNEKINMLLKENGYTDEQILNIERRVRSVSLFGNPNNR